MNSLTNLINDGVKIIEPTKKGGISVLFEDDTILFITSDLSSIEIEGTFETNCTRIVLKSHVLTKAKLIVQELTSIIEKIEAEQS